MNPEEREVLCPVCEANCSEVYIGLDGRVVGCDICISKRSAADWHEDLGKEWW